MSLSLTVSFSVEVDQSEIKLREAVTKIINLTQMCLLALTGPLHVEIV